MTFAEFVECAMDIQFLEYQKEYLNELYERFKCGEFDDDCQIIRARGSNKTDLLPLLAAMSIIYGQQFERSKNDQN